MKKEFLDFESARDFVRNLKLKNFREWVIYCKTQKPFNIPYCPNIYYRSRWISFQDWLGYSYKKGDGNRKYHVNEFFFKTWSHDMAYILGLWFADGNIFGTRFSISQHKKDKYILEDILAVMGSNHPLKRNGNVLYFSIGSKEIVRDIKILGGKERKSLDVEFPNIPKEYLHDFIRGYFDGDGCIYFMKSRKSFLANIASGSKQFIIGLVSAIQKHTDVKCSMMPVFTKKGVETWRGTFLKKDCALYSIRFSRNNTIRFGHFMYQNCGMKLLRKYQLFQKAGDIKIIKSGFLTYEEAKKIILPLLLRSSNDWIDNYCNRSLRPVNIPYSPNRTYKNKGWISWQEFLGYKKKRTKKEVKCV